MAGRNPVGWGHDGVRVGLVSDTHGALPRWVHIALVGVDRIVHAGDVGGLQVLDELACIAPVDAVLGNTDSLDAARELPHNLRLDIGGLRVLVVHDPTDAAQLLAESEADVVIVGHTHRPRVQRVGDRLFVNPGSTSRSRGEGHSIALLRIEGSAVGAEILRPPPRGQQ